MTIPLYAVATASLTALALAPRVPLSCRIVVAAFVLGRSVSILHTLNVTGLAD